MSAGLAGALVLVAAVASVLLWSAVRRRRRMMAALHAAAVRLDPSSTERPRSMSEATRWLSRAVDRSERRAAEADAATQRALATIDVVPHPVIVGDASGEVVHRNPAAVAEDEAARSGPIVAANLREAMDDAAGGLATDRPLRLFGPPRRRLQVLARPLLSDGDLLGVGAAVLDTSEAERADEIRRDFIANLSHELKTPVGAVSLLAETLLDEDDAVVRRRLLERTHIEAQRMGRIIDVLLELAELEADGELRHEVVRIADIAAEAADQAAGPAERYRSKVIVGHIADVAVLGDRHLLVRAVVNLLENAMKYSGEGSEVRIEAFERGGEVDLDVADEGIGIPGKHLDRIFERFYRVDRARSRASGGTGLGLSIVRHAVERHGGEVLVESREGVGSTFTLRLPVAPPDPHVV